MGRRWWNFSQKWLILGFLALAFPLFQNMSPVDEFQDIRKIAPRKPSGEWDHPLSTYVPKDFSGSSLGDVQRSFLSYNFDPYFKDLELTYLSSFSGRSLHSPTQMTLGSESETTESDSRWKIGLVNPTKLRFSYESLAPGKNFQLMCEAESGHDGMSVKLSRPLSSNLNLGVLHQTSRRESQVQFDYRW